MTLRLHGYWRSGAAYRVRIALALKGLEYEQVAHDLRTGAQGAEAYAALNPQKLVPALEVDGPETERLVLTQSGAIIEWLDERFPDPPLLPPDPDGRAQVRAMVLLIAADIHPLHNLRILKSLKHDFGLDEARSNAWVGRWMTEGLAALETAVRRHGRGFCHGDRPTIADCFLLPQLYSAARFGVDTGGFPSLRAVADRADALPAFQAAHPAAQPDAD